MIYIQIRAYLSYVNAIIFEGIKYIILSNYLVVIGYYFPKHKLGFFTNFYIFKKFTGLEGIYIENRTNS